MNRTSHRTVPAVLALAVAIIATPVSAQLAGVTEINWFTIDGGGGTSTGLAFELSGTIGQPDAGVPMTGPGFELVGGFWPGGTRIGDCPGDIVPSGTVNIDDLLAVISAWGACPLPCPPRCAADIVPPGAGPGVCAVNIDDLLAVISAWGACP